MRLDCVGRFSKVMSVGCKFMSVSVPLPVLMSMFMSMSMMVAVGPVRSMRYQIDNVAYPIRLQPLDKPL